MHERHSTRILVRTMTGPKRRVRKRPAPRTAAGLTHPRPTPCPDRRLRATAAVLAGPPNREGPLLGYGRFFVNRVVRPHRSTWVFRHGSVAGPAALLAEREPLRTPLDLPKSRVSPTGNSRHELRGPLVELLIVHFTPYYAIGTPDLAQSLPIPEVCYRSVQLGSVPRHPADG